MNLNTSYTPSTSNLQYMDSMKQTHLHIRPKSDKSPSSVEQKMQIEKCWLLSQDERWHLLIGFRDDAGHVTVSLKEILELVLADHQVFSVSQSIWPRVFSSDQQTLEHLHVSFIFIVFEVLLNFNLPSSEQGQVAEYFHSYLLRH